MSGKPYFFPDNTVLINMAILDCVELLDRFVQKRGRWCASIEYEWRRSHRVLNLSSQADSQVRRMCGQPILDPSTGARSYAEAEAAVDRCLGTAELLAYFEVLEWINRAVAHDHLITLQKVGRHVRPSTARGYDQLANRLIRRMK